MDFKLGVWSVMKYFRLDELICANTNRESVFRKVIPRSRAYRHEKFEHSVNKNLKILIDRGDYTQWRIFSGRLYINSRIFEHLKVDPQHFVMFDIGANIGGFTVLFAQEINVKNYEVHLFEPNPGVIPTLQFNIDRLKNSSSVVKPTIAALALGETEATLPLKIDQEHSGLATLGVPESFDHTVNVKVIPLDTYVDDNQIRKIDFIKIDVESYEPGVLNGGRNLLKKFKPVLYMEYSVDWFQNFSEEYIKDLLTFLKDTGYQFFRETRKGELVDLPMTPEGLKEYNHLNILAVCKK